MRQLAIKCLENAKYLITKDDDESLKYASLELRFCIEYITYSQLLIYLNEVPDETFKKWTPKSIINDLLTVDPDADKSVLIFGGIEDKKGIHTSKMHFLGEDRRFSLKWDNKQHNALGNFLHAPTLQQIEKGEAPTKDKIINKVTEVINEIEKILYSTVFNSKVEFYCWTFECKFCKSDVKYGAEAINKRIVYCKTCKAKYDIFFKKENEINFKAREFEYICDSCGTYNVIGLHLIYFDHVLSCTNCDVKYKIVYDTAPI